MKCETCDEGYVNIVLAEHLTKDKAEKLGVPELEGQLWIYDEEVIGCKCCHGNWQDCPKCTAKEKAKWN